MLSRRSLPAGLPATPLPTTPLPGNRAGWLPVLPPATVAQGGSAKPAVIRAAETETLLRTCANPLFRAAGLGVNLVRNIHLSDAAIDSFVNTGNRCSSPPCR